MSHCSDIEPLITPYVDEDLDPASRARVSAHLERCGPCRSAATAEQDVRGWMRAHATRLRGAAPAPLASRCHAAWTRGAAPRSAWRPWSIAATILLTLVGAGLWTAGSGRSVMAAQLRDDHERCFNRMGAPPATPSIELEGQTVVVPVVLEGPALPLRALRRCRLGPLGTAHALYGDHGEQVSLFVASDAGAARFVPAIMGYEVRTWHDAGRQYALVGRLTSTDMDVLAHAIRAGPR